VADHQKLLPKIAQLQVTHLGICIVKRLALNLFCFEVDSFLEALESHIHHHCRAEAYPTIHQCKVDYVLRAISPNVVVAACYQACLGYQEF